MKGILGSRRASRARSKLIAFAILLLLSLLAVAWHQQPVRAQALFDLSWTFDYSPLVSGATNTVHVLVRNTALVPLRLLSVGIRFPWMQGQTYLSPGEPQGTQNLSAEQEVRYNFSFAVPENVLAGTYSTTTFLQFQRFQITPSPHWSGVESTTYVIDNVIMYSRSSPFSIRIDPYDGRIYSAIALITLVGWYLPKRLRLGAKG